jgi:hypothetical protein
MSASLGARVERGRVSGAPIGAQREVAHLQLEPRTEQTRLVEASWPGSSFTAGRASASAG